MDFNAALQTWIAAVTRPGTEFFEQESMKPEANLNTAIIWVVAAGVIASILMALSTGWVALGFIIGFPIGFLIGVGIYHLLANLFGGKGDYGKFAYLASTFYAPILVANGVLSLIPFIGSFLSSILGIYGLVLLYFATKVNYRLSDRNALFVVLIPAVVAVLIGIFVAVLFVAALSGLNG